MEKIFFVVLYSLLIFSSAYSQMLINDGYGDYLLVSAGRFQMGDNFNEGVSDEKPVHSVYLEKYYIGKLPITNEEYKKFIDDGGYSKEKYWRAGGYNNYGKNPLYWNDLGYMGGGITGNGKFPVVGVSWYEANAYCLWLSEKTGKSYRLPTEAEWEKAARGGDQRRFPWGNIINGNYANYDSSGDPYNNLTPSGYYDGTSRMNFSTHNNVSPYGVYDMAGNIWEWCDDWYYNDYYSISPVKNPKGPTLGKIKVIRGGSWKSVVGSLRAAKRSGNDPPTRRAPTLGFRCVRDK